MFTHYENTKGDEICKNKVVWGVRGHPRSPDNIAIRYSTYDFLLDFNRNCIYLVPFSSYTDTDILLTSSSAVAEGPRNALVSRNSATTKHPI